MKGRPRARRKAVTPTGPANAGKREKKGTTETIPEKPGEVN